MTKDAKNKKKRKELTGSVHDRIEVLFYDLTKTEKKLAEYLLDHPREPQYMSISELAEVSGVAEATISRFCRKLGLKGFNAFKLELAKAWMAKEMQKEAVIDVTGTDDLSALAEDLGKSLTQAIQQTYDFIDPDAYRAAAETLLAAERVYCMGLGGSSVLAREAASLFQTLTPKFTFVGDPHFASMLTAQMGEGDVIFYFSYSGATHDLIETFELAEQYKVQKILVTRFPNSPGGELANIKLQCGSNETAMRSGSVAARVAQLAVIELLYELYVAKAGPEAVTSREQAMEALSEKLL